MKKDKDFNMPDSIRPLLDEVAERLWSNQAAVMVGTGFSKNASADFPDWNQLGDVLYEKIHGQKPDDKIKYLNVLKICRMKIQSAFRLNISTVKAGPSAGLLKKE